MDVSSDLLVLLDNSQLMELGAAVSRLLGWIYFAAWSTSFYPQAIKTHRRRSVTGLSVDFFTINFIGFFAYSLSTSLLLWSPKVREEYAAHHPSAPTPSVRYNDLAFGVHAFILAVIMWLQLWAFGFTRDPFQRISWGMIGVMTGSALSVATFTSLAYFEVGDWEALDVVNTLSYIKIVISILKYIPQVRLNYERKSTDGWSIHNILFDSTGGVLSLAQLILDSAMAGDVWAGTFGNPLKFWLGAVTLFFDSIFVTQHYYWFKGNKPYSYQDVEGRNTRPEEERSPPKTYGSVTWSQPILSREVPDSLASSASVAPLLSSSNDRI